MSKRFGRNQKRRMREEIAGLHETVVANQRACSEQFHRANRLAEEMRRSVLVEVVPLPDNVERQSRPMRVTARFHGATLSYQQEVDYRQLQMSLCSPERRADYCRQLANLMFERLSRA